MPKKEDVLVDLTSFTSPQNSSPVLWNTTGASNPRPPSLLVELETLHEVEGTLSPSPRLLKPSNLLFDFNDVKEPSSDGTTSPSAGELRERSGSSDTLTYEDLPTPTPSASPHDDVSTSNVDQGERGLLFDLAANSEEKEKEMDLLTLEDNDEDDSSETTGLLIPLNDNKNLESENASSVSSSQDELASFGSQDDLLSSSVESEGWKNENSFDSLGDLRMGQVICVGDKKTGRIRYLGPTEFSPGTWVGVELDTPSGKFHSE